MRKTRYIPPLVTLSGGAIAIVITTWKRYELQYKLIVVLAVLLIFFFLGSLVRLVLDKNTTVKEQTIADEGEVIEKTGQEEQDETTEDKTVS